MSNDNRNQSSGCATFVAVAAAVIVTIIMAAIVAAIIAVACGLFGLLKGLVTGSKIPFNIMGQGGRMTDPNNAGPNEKDQKDFLARVIGRQPKGTAAEFGWDLAYPTKYPYEVEARMGETWRQRNNVINQVLSEANMSVERVNAAEGTTEYRIAKARHLPFAWGFKLGVNLSVAVAIFGFWANGRVRSTFALRKANKGEREEERVRAEINAVARCMYCQREMDIPSYQCSCGQLHHDLTPGPLGVEERQCRCGQMLPVGIKRASESLLAFCPHCTGPLPHGTGTRRMVVVPVFGSVSSGKTNFLTSLTARMAHDLPNVQIAPLSNQSADFLNNALSMYGGQRSPLKTEVSDTREAYSLKVDNGSDETEVHLIDAAGESFLDNETSQNLIYFDKAKTMVLTIDPLAIEDVRSELSHRPGFENYRPNIAHRDADTAFGAVIDRIRNAGEDMSDREVVFVVTKADAIQDLYPESNLEPSNDNVRNWLMNNGAGNLINRAELNVGKVSYFAVDSVTNVDPNAPFSPLHVVNWLFDKHGGNLTAVSKMEPAQ